MTQFDDYADDNKARYERRVLDAPALPQNVRERQAQHRKHLTLAMQALPSEEVLDIVAAAITSRADYDPQVVAKFSAEMSNWAWPYVVAK